MRVAVIGGGITGLSAAFEASGDPSVDRVVVFEASERAGGKLHTAEVNGTPVELGADSFLARVPHAVELCRELGLASDLIAPRTQRAYILFRGELRPMPSGPLLGVPSGIWPMVRAGLASPSALMAPVTKGRPRISGDDVSVHDLIASRLGPQIADRYTAPLLGGVYACDIRDLSAAACTPDAFAVALRGGSLLQASKSRSGSSGPVFMSLRGGLRTLVKAISDLPSIEVRTNSAVRALSRSSGSFGVFTDGDEERFEVVIVTTPAPVTATLLASLSSDASLALRRIRYSDVAHVLLGFERGSVRLPSGSGFLSADGGVIRGCTWMTQKWDLETDLELIRCSVHPGLDDDEMVSSALDELSRVIGIDRAPEVTRTQRWPGGLPCYEVGHPALVEQIRSALSHVAGLAVAGAAIQGVGIAACVEQGRRAARNTLESVHARR